jgi:hypothetical protein
MIIRLIYNDGHREYTRNYFYPCGYLCNIFLYKDPLFKIPKPISVMVY